MADVHGCHWECRLGAEAAWKLGNRSRSVGRRRHTGHHRAVFSVFLPPFNDSAARAVNALSLRRYVRGRTDGMGLNVYKSKGYNI